MAATTFRRSKSPLANAPILTAQAVDTPAGPEPSAQQPQERRPIPAPFITQNELERNVGLSPNGLADWLSRTGWKSLGASLHLGRGLGSPRVFPLALLPAAHLARSGASDEAADLIGRNTVLLDGRWAVFLALLDRRTTTTPSLGWAIASGDAVAIARDLASGPDLLRFAEELSIAQIDAIEESPSARIGVWRKIPLSDQADAVPLPDELQSGRTGDVGLVIAIATSGVVRLLYRVAMPARAIPLEPGMTPPSAGPDTAGVGAGIRRARGLARRSR